MTVIKNINVEDVTTKQVVANVMPYELRGVVQSLLGRGGPFRSTPKEGISSTNC